MLEFLLKKNEWQNLKIFTDYDIGSYIECVQEISELLC